MNNKSSLLAYGSTGAGKTGLIASWIRAIHAKTGKKCRYYTRESNGVGTLQSVVNEGLVDICDLSPYPFVAESIDIAANGGWPDAAGILKRPVDLTKELADVGGLIYEGGTSFGEDSIEELCAMGAANQIIGAEKPPQQFTSGQLRIAGANQTYYGMVQKRLRKAIMDSHRLPVHLAWTMREKQVDDENEVSGFRAIHGPQLIGSALTPHVPAWFGRTIHVDTEQEVDVKTKAKVTVRRAFFKTHFYEGDKAPYIANPRVAVGIVDAIPESKVIDTSESIMLWLFNYIEELMAGVKK